MARDSLIRPAQRLFHLCSGSGQTIAAALLDQCGDWMGRPIPVPLLVARKPV
jgi:hypothetical protein